MVQNGLSITTDLISVVKVGFLIFSVLYFIFSLVIIRQVSLMAETVTTQFGAVLRILSIAFALLSLAVLIFFISGA